MSCLVILFKYRLFLICFYLVELLDMNVRRLNSF